MSRRGRQRGSAMLMVLILTALLLAGGAVFVGLQLSSTRAGALVKDSTTALNCAESAVAAARPLVAGNFANWNTSLCDPIPPRGTGTCVIGSAVAEPAWLAPIQHDLDGDTVPDFVITLVDNDDEAAPDPFHDTDSTIYIIATCVQHEARAQVSELVHYDGVTGALTRKLWLRTE